MTIGHRISTDRTAKKWSQHYLAERINEITGGRKTRNDISNIENDRKVPAAAMLVTIATILEQDPVRYCAIAGQIHPDIAQALENPDFAVFVFNSIPSEGHCRAEGGGLRAARHISSR